MTRHRREQHPEPHRERGSVSSELVIATPFLVLLLVFVAVVIHRGVDARLRLDDVAHQAARAASLTRTPADATHAAQQTVAAGFAGTRTCTAPDVTVNTARFAPGGTVSVAVSCEVNLTGAAPFLPAGTKRMTATATSPIDLWRSTEDTP